MIKKKMYEKVAIHETRNTKVKYMIEFYSLYDEKPSETSVYRFYK